MLIMTRRTANREKHPRVLVAAIGIVPTMQVIQWRRKRSGGMVGPAKSEETICNLQALIFRLDVAL
jgi:hypothetical protein